MLYGYVAVMETGSSLSRRIFATSMLFYPRPRVFNVYHLGAQTAVTTSVADPRADMEVNVLETFNALEASRLVGENPIRVFTYTNKVYGGMEDVRIEEAETRYDMLKAFLALRRIGRWTSTRHTGAPKAQLTNTSETTL